MSSNNRNDALREHFRTAMDKNDPSVIRAWAISDGAKSMLSWQILSEAWALCSNKAMLNWSLLHECIELAHAHAVNMQKTRLSTLHSFAVWLNTSEPHWIAQLDVHQAHNCIEQAVEWHRVSDKNDAYSMQALQTGILMQLSIGCKQGRIWRDYPDLKISPLDVQYAMQCTEAAHCRDTAIYDALWWHKQLEMSKIQWKLEMVNNKQMHNLSQFSTTPFVACEYIIEQHAQPYNQSSYAQLIKSSQFSSLREVDAWMLCQLENQSGTWQKAQCPLPGDKHIQSWWYLLQLGVDDDALLQALHCTELDDTIALALPEGSFTPQELCP